MIDHMREQKFGDFPNVEAYENLKSIANLSIARATTAITDGTHDATLFGRVNNDLAGAIESVGRLAAAVRKARDIVARKIDKACKGDETDGCGLEGVALVSELTEQTHASIHHARHQLAEHETLPEGLRESLFLLEILEGVLVRHEGELRELLEECKVLSSFKEKDA